jgi:membrane-associated phospholipid phosphatase
MAELYWQAILRDVPFTEYAASSLASQAAGDLSRFASFRGPRLNGQVTPQTLFRGFTSGDLQGLCISQFLLRPIPFGAQAIDQRIRTYASGLDHVTQFLEWLNIQNGCLPSGEAQFDPMPRYVRNGRDLARWVHVDVLFQAYFNAALILLTPPDPADPLTGGGIGAPLNPANPYNTSRTQTGFGTFGAPHIATVVAEVATRALKAVWFQKWFVHRRLRPEAFGGRVHSLITKRSVYPIHQDLLTSPSLQHVFNRHGSYLLPQAFPEGSPLHPSYGAGHATVAGACVTVLKAFFDESFVIPNPVIPSTDGLALLPYPGPNLTVGGELNKLASNVALGRNFAGIHWRSDYTESLRLGEAVAISVLQDQRLTYKEGFIGFTFTRFDGSRITI